MYPRRYVHIHADVQILKLRVHQGVDEASPCSSSNTNARLETSGCDRDSIANAKFGSLSIDDADFRVIDDVRRAVRHQEICLRAGQRQAVIRGRKVLQLIQRESSG